MRKLYFFFIFILKFFLFASPIYKEFNIRNQKVNKWVEPPEITEYDSSGNEIYYAYDGYEYWSKFDSNNNLINKKDNNGREESWLFDSNGNEIYYKNSDGYEQWTKYDSYNNRISCKDNRGNEEIWENEYDSNGLLINSKSSKGSSFHRHSIDKSSCIYDSNGNIIYYKKTNGEECWNEYDFNNNLIHCKESDGIERWTEYNSSGKEIHFYNKSGTERWSEYDNNGNLLHWKFINHFDNLEEEWWEYDLYNNLIYYKDNDGNERFYENEYDSNNHLHKVLIYSSF